MLTMGASPTLAAAAGATQDELTEQLTDALNEALEALAQVVTYTQGTDGLISSDASNLSTNATSLSLTALVNGDLNETTETWSDYPSDDAYLQVDLTGKGVTDLYITIAPRTGEQYYNDTPKSWIVTASDDGTDWIYIGEYATDGSLLAAGSIYTYPVVNLGAAYNYVRFTSPEALYNRTGNTRHFALAEFQLYQATAQEFTDANLADAVENLQSEVDIARLIVTTNTATESDITNLNAAVDDLAAILTQTIQTDIDSAEGYTMGTGMNSYSCEGYTTEQWFSTMEEFKTLVASDSLTIAELAAVYAEVTGMVDNLTLNLPKDGTFMRIRNSSETTKYMQVADAGEYARVALSEDGTTKESIYCYYNGKLLNYSTGYYLYCYSTAANNGWLRTTTDAESSLADGVDITFSLSTYTDGCYNINYSTSYGTPRRLVISSATSSVSSATIASKPTAGTALTLEEVTALPIPLIGSGPYYSTVNLPVAVTLPDGLAAYSVSEGDSVLYLHALGTSTIPANTPVLLYSESSADFDLTITDDDTEALSTGLEGTVAAATVDADTHYVLDTDTSVVGFYNYSGTEMPAFTAYFTPGTTATDAFTLVFPDDDDDPTGVDAISIADTAADAPYYDLQGRKVAAPMRGQIYIHAGKKVRY